MAETTGIKICRFFYYGLKLSHQTHFIHKEKLWPVQVIMHKNLGKKLILT